MPCVPALVIRPPQKILGPRAYNEGAERAKDVVRNVARPPPSASRMSGRSFRLPDVDLAKILGSSAGGLGIRMTNLSLRLAFCPAPVRARILAVEVGEALADGACRALGLSDEGVVGSAVEMGLGLAVGLGLSGLELDPPLAFGASVIGLMVGRQLGQLGARAVEAVRGRRADASTSDEVAFVPSTPLASIPHISEIAGLAVTCVMIGLRLPLDP